VEAFCTHCETQGAGTFDKKGWKAQITTGKAVFWGRGILPPFKDVGIAIHQFFFSYQFVFSRFA
jgi:hypothetical protein